MRLETMKFQIHKINTISENWGDEADDFFIQAHCEVRTLDEQGGEAFVAKIVSPKAFQKEMDAQDDFSYEIGRGYIITNDFDKIKITEILQKLLIGSNADNWNELFSYMKKYFDWIE